jgi:fluoroacetyl-CoA thioesterase
VDADVRAEDTARALGSGEVDVLGTPRVVALAEAATVAALASALPPESTSVGSRVELDHLAPTRVGRQVRAEAVLHELTGRRLVFAVSVTEISPSGGSSEVARGTVTRVIVERDSFPG